MNKNIAILGSGIVGLCSGYHLLKKGNKVIFFDRNEPGSGASYGNAGSFSNYGAVGLNQPSIFKNLPKYLFSSYSPLSIKFNYLVSILPWAVKFLQNCNLKSMRDTAEKMHHLLTFSIAEYEKIFLEIGASHLMERTGVMYIYNNENDPRVIESTKLREYLKVKQNSIISQIKKLEDQIASLKNQLKEFDND